MQSLTMAQAKQDFGRGLLAGVAIYVHEAPALHYTVSFETALATETNGLPLVDARSKEPRRFTTMDAVHSAIRQVGFKPSRFWVIAT